MQRPDGNKDTKAKHQQPEAVFLQAAGQGLFRQRVAQGNQIKTVGPTLHVDGDQTNQREHRAQRQIDRHLHGRIVAVPATPDADHDEGWDQREFVEEVEIEHIYAREHAHQAALHDQQQHEVNLQPLCAGLNRVETGRQTDDTGEREERHRNAVQAQLQRDAEMVEAR